MSIFPWLLKGKKQRKHFLKVPWQTKCLQITFWNAGHCTVAVKLDNNIGLFCKYASELYFILACLSEKYGCGWEYTPLGMKYMLNLIQEEAAKGNQKKHHIQEQGG